MKLPLEQKNKVKKFIKGLKESKKLLSEATVYINIPNDNDAKKFEKEIAEIDDDGINRLWIDGYEVTKSRKEHNVYYIKNARSKHTYSIENEFDSIMDKLNIDDYTCDPDFDN